ncbi:MAG: aspartate carbamoyltransferase catalytic subunit [Candidatus Obscuribacterales bacterium]|nr:aspartate carbamoyltransferase catalytic subunit [Candidatus Obscuribacterales bacterium]
MYPRNAIFRHDNADATSYTPQMFYTYRAERGENTDKRLETMPKTPDQQATQPTSPKSSPKAWTHKRHLLDTEDLAADEAMCIMEQTAEFKRTAEHKKAFPSLSSKTVATVFYENSTRTRSSFELATKRLGAQLINLDVNTSSVTKGETLRDTARTLISMGADAIIQRHSASGSAHLLAKMLGDQVSVVNAGDGWHAHPTQALLDLFTMLESRPQLQGAKVTIVGDILHSRVARSNISLLKKFGVEIHVAGPPTLVPPLLTELGVIRHSELDSALDGADFVIALRLQMERQQQGLITSIGEYQKLYRLDHARLRNASKNVRVLHPGPSNRGVEITDALHDDKEISLINAQVANGVLVRMAVLYLLLNE